MISSIAFIVLFVIHDTVLFRYSRLFSSCYSKVKFCASAIYCSSINIILVCLNYIGHAHNFLAQGYQLHKSMDMRYGIEKLPVLLL